MNQVFTDTWAWVALVDKKDSEHEKAKHASKKLLEQKYVFVTTNFFCGNGDHVALPSQSCICC